MGGLFGIVSEKDCVQDLFYGTDYHSHLGTVRGGLAIKNEEGLTRIIHDITNTPFRSKFEHDIQNMRGKIGIGVISDTDPQPLIISSHLGTFSIATVSKINNKEEIVENAFQSKKIFTETNKGEINPTELVASLISQQSSFEEGIEYAQESIKGSCSLLLLTETENRIYAARDKLGRTPLITGKKQDTFTIASETTAFPTLNFEIGNYLGPGEIVLITPEGIETKKPASDKMQICSFLWVYFGFPASSYEGINVETTRYKCGAILAKHDDVEIEFVAGIPDSGTAHAIGYANQKKVPYQRPFVKYTPTWPRSFMPQDQKTRDLIARMKLIPIREIIQGKRILLGEDSIVRGTQLQDTIKLLYTYGAKEIHMRPACPPLIFNCDFLNFSRSRSAMDLATRKSIKELTGHEDLTQEELAEYANPHSEKYHAMNERTRRGLNLTSLKYQSLDNLVNAIGLPKERLCTHCWDNSSYF